MKQAPDTSLLEKALDNLGQGIVALERLRTRIEAGEPVSPSMLTGTLKLGVSIMTASGTVIEAAVDQANGVPTRAPQGKLAAAEEAAARAGLQVIGRDGKIIRIGRRVESFSDPAGGSDRAS
ncbi:hypothetical protein ACFFUB_00330 [Algimonas porphyrae]|uniref:Uncharacterized protein n=1 Tax=Algimonas porphyrae TaxID=1128113 RepID=A0ABQ5UYU2_9PROT|nr:hypothetical protein [Algimonas porphyrae]GLQ20475.1 hypothetical protein GCM10007854_14300 [Algimonas porphyrae]